MPQPVLNPRASQQLTAELTLKGKVGLQVDETVVPVDVLRPNTGVGDFHGLLSRAQQNIHTEAGTLHGLSVDPYSQILAGLGDPSSRPTAATHWCWLLSVGLFSTTTGITEAYASILLPVKSPELAAADAVVPLAWVGTWSTLQTIAGPNLLAGLTGSFGQSNHIVAGAARLPFYFPPGAFISLDSLAGAAVTCELQATWWAGPIGVLPPGA